MPLRNLLCAIRKLQFLKISRLPILAAISIHVTVIPAPIVASSLRQEHVQLQVPGVSQSPSPLAEQEAAFA
jgi:hypothetical protein